MPRKNKRSKNKRSNKKTICLVMIVKNESKVIKRAFDSVHKYIDYWVICDTGSTDGTQKIIKDYFNEKKIPGELHEHKWKNFGHNRSLVVKNAKGKADYGLLMDADFMFVIKDPDFKKKLNTKGGHMVGYEGSLDFRQNLFIDLTLDWYYKGVTHEYITCDQKIKMQNIDYFKFTHKADGGSRSDKFERDIRMLEQGLIDEPNNIRYMFYLAQSYYSIGDYKKSLEFYQKRVNKGGWEEEVYFSMFRAGICKIQLNMDFNDFRKDLFNAYKFRPIRLEALHSLCSYCYNNSLFDIGYQYALNAIDNKYPHNDVLFISKNIHEYDFWVVFGLLAIRSLKFDEGFNIFNKLVKNNSIPPLKINNFKKIYITCLNIKKEYLSEIDNSEINKVAIILVNYNMKEKTEKIIKHLEKTIKHPYDLITVDNGSNEKEKINATINLKNNIHITNGILVALNYADTLEVTNNEKYLGYSIIDSNIEFVNDDDILTQMVKTLKSDSNIVGIAPSLKYDSKTNWDIFKNSKDKKKENIYFIQDHFSLYRASWFNKVGRYNRDLKYGWGIDIENGYNAYKDHKVMILDNTLLIKYNGSINYNKKSNKEKGDDMNLYFIKKYGTNYHKIIYKDILKKTDFTHNNVKKLENNETANKDSKISKKEENLNMFKSLLTKSDEDVKKVLNKTNNKYKLKILAAGCFLRFGHTHYGMQGFNQFKEYFINDYDFSMCNTAKEESDICITSIYSTSVDELVFSKSKVNMIICIENILNKRFNHYTHYNKYGEYGDDRINIYVYNHIDKVRETKKYLSIPTVYFRLDYFKLKYPTFRNDMTLKTCFKDKKFCLMVNKSGINKQIDEYVKMLNTIDKVDHISLYDDKVKNKSCFNSIELLQVFNKYKFILVVENSYSSGYITEKIFNVLFSNSIPIYSGSDIIEKFVNKDCFVNMRNNELKGCMDRIKELNTNEELYNKYLNLEKLNEYDDENYKVRMKQRIDKLCR